ADPDSVRQRERSRHGHLDEPVGPAGCEYELGHASETVRSAHPPSSFIHRSRVVQVGSKPPVRRRLTQAVETVVEAHDEVGPAGSWSDMATDEASSTSSRRSVSPSSPRLTCSRTI